MKTILLVLFICCGSLSADSTSAVTCEYDWNRDKVLDKFIVYPYHQSQGETGQADLLKLSIHLSGKGDFEFVDKDSSWVAYSNSEASHAPQTLIRRKNLLKSKYLALLNVMIAHNPTPVLCVFSFAPTMAPGFVDIYALDKTGAPAKILSEGVDLCDILDINNDGYSEIVLSPETEYWENYYEQYHYSTYAPYYVYTINDSLKLTFDVKLTGLYNKKCYVGWVGLDSARHYIIWDNPKTKKRILTTLEQAKKRYFK